MKFHLKNTYGNLDWWLNKHHLTTVAYNTSQPEKFTTSIYVMTRTNY